jgi:hypothetical protein
MKNFLRSLLSVGVDAKLSSSWGDDEPDDTLVEVVGIDAAYTQDQDFNIEETRFWETNRPWVNVNTVALSFNLLNFHLLLSVSWETEP